MAEVAEIAGPQLVMQMRFFRYRRPSLKSVLGITKAKKQLKKELGITNALKPFRAWTNLKRKFKRDIGYESETGRLIRHGLPRPAGCMTVLLILAMIFMVVHSLWATSPTSP